MNKILLVSALITVFISCNPSKQKVASTSSTLTETHENEWITLFDGSSTDQWRGVDMEIFPDSGWYIKNKELLNDGSGKGNLITREQYSIFILEWEWRLMDEGGNSGVKYIVKEIEDDDGKYALGLEYQMLDDAGHEWMKNGKMKPNDYHTTGALYEFYEPAENKIIKPVDEFNKSIIKVSGSHVEHWLNGEKIVEYERGGDDFLIKKSKTKLDRILAYMTKDILCYRTIRVE